jgi:hypothetical protein
MNMNIEELRSLQRTPFLRLAGVLVKRFDEITPDNYETYLKRGAVDTLIKTETREQLEFHFKIDDLSYASAIIDFREGAAAGLSLRYVPVGYYKKKRTWKFYAEVLELMQQLFGEPIAMDKPQLPILEARTYASNTTTVLVTTGNDEITKGLYVLLTVDPS